MNRSEYLRDLLLSILKQEKIPKEVIIVDDSDDYKTRQMIQQLENHFLGKEIQLKYLRPPKNGKESISRARNIGATEAACDIVFFLDDDVVIEENYVEEILKVFKIYSEALGVQGDIVKSRKKKFLRVQKLLRKIFYLSHEENGRRRVLPSGNPTHPASLREVIQCEWLSGTNCAYRKKVFTTFRFNEKLLEYSFGEDKEMSYKIQKKHPQSLYMTPHARVHHKTSPIARRCTRAHIYIETVYTTYFFYNNIEQALSNKIVFLWSMFGRPLVTFKSLYSRAGLKGIFLLIQSYIWTFKHINEVKKGEFSFLMSC